MDCSGTNVCNIIDIVIWLLVVVSENCCTGCPEIPLSLTVLPSFIVDVALDLFGFLVMLSTACVYRDETGEYNEGAEDYIFSFDPTSLYNYCNLTDAQLRNLTEVTHHQDFVQAFYVWGGSVIMFFLISVCTYLVLGCIAVKKCIDKCTGEGQGGNNLHENESVLTLSVCGFVFVFGVMKLINFYALMVIMVKGCFVIYYVTPSPLEGIVFALSVIDMIWNTYEFVELGIIGCKCKTEADIRARMQKAFCCSEGCKTT